MGGDNPPMVKFNFQISPVKNPRTRSKDFETAIHLVGAYSGNSNSSTRAHELSESSRLQNVSAASAKTG